MAEYIEREKVIDELEHLYEDAELSYLGVYDCIENVPTADVVEVVFCKDCEHCEHIYPECDINGNCREAYYCKSIKSDVKPDDYCCWGERRCEE